MEAVQPVLLDFKEQNVSTYAKPGCMEMTVLRSVEPASIPLLVITYLEVVISDVLQDGKIHPCAMKIVLMVNLG